MLLVDFSDEFESGSSWPTFWLANCPNLLPSLSCQEHNLTSQATMAKLYTEILLVEFSDKLECWLPWPTDCPSICHTFLFKRITLYNDSSYDCEIWYRDSSCCSNLCHLDQLSRSLQLAGASRTLWSTCSQWCFSRPLCVVQRMSHTSKCSHCFSSHSCWHYL